MFSTKIRIRAFVISLLALSMLLAACGDNTPTTASVSPTAGTTPTVAAATATTGAQPATTAPQPTATAIAQLPTATAMPQPTAAPTTNAPAATPTSAPTTAPAATATTAPTTAPAQAGTPQDVGTSLFIDDRSNAVQVLRSYYNAINRKEYVRAYSYWTTPGSNGQPPAYPQFEKGYTNTASVQLTTGTIHEDAGAGNYYFSVPVTLKATNTDGSAQTFVGCYVVHQANPALFEAPLFQPMSINSANVNVAPAGADLAQLMANSCPNTSGLPVVTPAPTSDPANIDKSRFLDDRSDPVQILRSYYNAINRQEYARAYYYWATTGTSATSTPPDPADFRKGYANTASVQLTTGKTTALGAAGSTYTSVPVVVVATNTNGSKHTFAGCYVTRQASDPRVYGAPPYQSLHLYSATIKEVPNNSDVTTLLNQPCQQ